MSKRCKSLGIAMLGTLLAAFAGYSSTLAQSGSTGGTIGDTNKTLSGERTTEPRTPARPRSKSDRPAESGGRVAVQPPKVSLTGRWSWSGDCNSGHFDGEFDLTETSPGHFSGSFAGTALHDIGNIVDGVVDGTSISFTRTTLASQHWSGQIRAGRIEGSISGSATCRWSAHKK